MNPPFGGSKEHSDASLGVGVSICMRCFFRHSKSPWKKGPRLHAIRPLRKTTTSAPERREPLNSDLERNHLFLFRRLFGDWNRKAGKKEEIVLFMKPLLDIARNPWVCLIGGTIVNGGSFETFANFS